MPSQTSNCKNTTPTIQCNVNLAERRRLAQEAQRKEFRANVERLKARLAREAAEADARRAAAQAKIIAERNARPPASAELDDLLADLEAEVAAETVEEVIETMTDADLDSIE